MKVPRRLVPLILGAAVPLGLANASEACPWVVDLAGPNDPSSGQFTSIQAAIDAYKASGPAPCSTIDVRSGSYANSVSVFDVVGPLTIHVEAGARIQPGSATGFEFRRSSDIALIAEAGAEILTSTNEPVSFKGGAAANADILVANWDIHDNGGGKDSACVDIEAGNVGIRIVNNICRDNGSTAIRVAGGVADSPNEIVNNTIVRNSKNGVRVEAGAVAVVANNLAAFNGAAGGSHFNFLIKTPKGSSSSPTLTLENNIAYGVDGDFEGVSSLGSNLDTSSLGGTLTLNDFFADPAANDFHLVAGSPAVDAGLPVSGFVPTEDFEGSPRFSPADIGYHELLPDLDLDGIADFIDNCPPVTIPELDGSKTYNPGQEDGDFDANGPKPDGYGNRCDTCWAVYNPADPGAPDADGDGRPDQTTAACEVEHLAEACPVTNDGTCEVLSVVDFVSAPAEGTFTVAPACLVNLRFDCERDGVPIPQKFFYYNFLSDALGLIPQGEPSLNTCNLEDYLPPAALQGEGTITCDIVYFNDIIPEDCDGTAPDVADCDEGALGTPIVFQGEIPSGTITVTLDPNAPDNDQACSPGFFKNDLEEWAPTGLSPEDDFDLTFGTDAFAPDISLLEALNLGGGDANLLARRGVSGLLSALHPAIRYPLSALQVIFTVRGAIDDDPPGEAAAAAETLPVSATSPGGCPL
jgi:hypothetical protein